MPKAKAVTETSGRSRTNKDLDIEIINTFFWKNWLSQTNLSGWVRIRSWMIRPFAFSCSSLGTL